MRLTAYRLAAWLLAGMLATLCSCTAAFAHTPPVPEGGIAAEETWNLNGSDEAVLVRGSSLSNPVLILLLLTALQH